MNNKKQNVQHPNKVNKSQKQNEEPWLGNPDDHEPTKKVTKEDINP
jgi:hypothetical protein